MSDYDDPYDDDLEPVNPRGGKRRAARDAMAPEALTEGDDIDRVCAFTPRLRNIPEPTNRVWWRRGRACLRGSFRSR